MEETTETTEEVTEIRDPEKVLESLKAANAEAKRYREERDALKAQLESVKVADTTWKAKAVTAHVQAALRAQGIKDTRRVMKFLDVEGIDLDDEDKLVGFDEKMKALRNDLPELFNPKKRVGGAADAFASGDVKTKKGGTELQVERIYAGR